MGDGDAAEERRRQRAEKAREQRAAQAVAAGREPGQRGRPSGKAPMGTAEAQPLGTAEAQPFIDAARCRLRELQSALVADNSVHVTFAGQGGSIALGTGLAVDQWQAAFGARGDAARLLLVAELERGVEQLRGEFPRRVHIGRVSGADASATQIMVWGANASNADLQNGTRIQGSGQAAAMGVQKPGVFGIITTPLCGPPPPSRLPCNRDADATEAERDAADNCDAADSDEEAAAEWYERDPADLARQAAEATAEVAKAVRVAEAAQSFQAWQVVIKLIGDAEDAASRAAKRAAALEAAQGSTEESQASACLSLDVLRPPQHVLPGCRRWVQVGPEHWMSEKVKGIRLPDGRAHLWRAPRSGVWHVTSLHGMGSGGEYPDLTSDFDGPSPCGLYEDGWVCFRPSGSACASTSGSG